MVCPRCGSVERSPHGNGSWIARETLMGRVSTLPLATAAVPLLAAGSQGARPEAAGRAGAVPAPIGGGAPTRIGPIGSGGSGPPREDAPQPPAGSARFRYTAWAGPGCTTGDYTERGRFENGDAGWYTVESGGFSGSPCDGRFSAVPMSGSPGQDRGSSAVWSWHLGEGFQECALTVFVPSSVRDRDVAGAPTVYRVLSDPHDTESAYTGFVVHQPEHRGTAVDVRSYPVKGETFAVQLVDRGRDWGDAALVGAHHAAAQLKASCH